MADIKISELPAVTSVAVTDELEVNNGGTSRKATPPQAVAGALGASGLIARTSATAVAARTITGTTDQITVTNGDGVSANPTIALATTVDLGSV